jgi:hypothetical protein
VSMTSGTATYQIIYQPDVEVVAMNGGSGNGTFNITALSMSTVLSAFGNAGNDDLWITPPPGVVAIDHGTVLSFMGSYKQVNTTRQRRTSGKP